MPARCTWRWKLRSPDPFDSPCVRVLLVACLAIVLCKRDDGGRYPTFACFHGGLLRLVPRSCSSPSHAVATASLMSQAPPPGTARFGRAMSRSCRTARTRATVTARATSTRSCSAVLRRATAALEICHAACQSGPRSAMCNLLSSSEWACFRYANAESSVYPALDSNGIFITTR